jgi:ERF superfamily
VNSVIDMSSASVERKDRPATALQPMPDATPMQMLAMAVQRGVKIEELKPLMDLQERWEANQARKAFENAIAAAKSEIKPILKTREVDFTTQKGRTNYKYEDLAQIALEIDPILAKYGLNYRHRSQQQGKTVTVTCVVAHRDGHHEENSLSADNDESGNKNSIQAVGSVATYLQRYTLKLALGLSASKDNDGRTPGVQKPTLSPDQIANLEALITEVGTNKINFLKWARVEVLEDILMSNYSACVQALESKRKG